MNALAAVAEGVTEAPSREPPSLLSRLGLFGLDGLAPVMVAALASEMPLLLIGPHGTGKTLLLTRIAEALGLVCRHYNASLVNFDDLIGFPVPGADGTLHYAQTPATIWGAGAVIFDEISRSRPEMQNKLFPIIHERRVQGLLLEDLRFRWAAMNPPAVDDDETGYAGSEPLDTALADRFGFIVEMPEWKGLSDTEQAAVILADPDDWDRDAAAELASVLRTVQASLTALHTALGERLAIYIRTLMALLAQAGIALSPRRGGMLLRSVISVHAAALVLDPAAKPADSAWLALVNALPQRAEGLAVSRTKVLAAHKQAWRLAAIKPADPLRYILTAADPVERIRLAVAAPRLPKGELSGIIADGVAQLPPGAREAAIVHVFESGALGRLNAAVAEEIATIYRGVAVPVEFSETLHAASPRFRTWKAIRNLLSRLDPAEPRAHLAANCLAAAFARGEITSAEEAEAAFGNWHEADRRLAGGALEAHD